MNAHFFPERGRDLDETEIAAAASPSEAARCLEIEAGGEIDSRVGPYRILKKIGEGGMGTVFLAEREDHFKHRVALKTLHPGKVNGAVIERFHAERQILADLNHPHIARIFDGGATFGTLPFFAMEYVEGEPIDRACADLGLREKLELFKKVCAAVHHAHRSLIVHRDLKPSNILVTAEGEPKLLDFGIAKILRHSPEDEERGVKQHPAPGPMTLAFASPEQLCGDPITIATDIYSLGVLLYLLLSGRHPYYQRQMQNPALMQAVLLDDPVPPSRAADPAVGEAVAGDLDMITLKALQKLPENRYDSAAQLAEEIQLHLEDLPIRAWPGTWRSRLRKAVRRNRLLTATAAFLLLFSGTVTFLWRYAVGQEAEARRAQARSERIQSFTLDFFESIEPDRLRGEAPDIKQIVDRGREKIEQSLHDEPSVRADILGSLAVIYDALALHEEALELQKEAVEHRRSLRPVDPRVMAVDLNNLASSYYGRDEFDRAELFFRESLPYWRDLEHPYEINAMANLAGVVGRQDRALEAIEIYRAALERAGALGLEETSHAAAAHFGLGVAQHRMGDSAGAEEHLRRAHLIYSLETATKPSKLAQVESSLGEVLQARGDLEAARLYLKSALATRLTIFGQKHARTAGLQEKLALLLIELGETAAAEELLQKAGDAYTALGNEDDASRIRKIAGPLTGPSLAAK